MILTLEKLEKDLEALSKLLKEDPSKLWEKAILGEAKGGDDSQVVKFEVALASLPMNEYGQKIYSNAMTYGGKDEEQDVQKVGSYLPKVYRTLRAGSPHGFFQNLADFMENPQVYLKQNMGMVDEKGQLIPGASQGLNQAQQMGFSFSALLAYKILLETCVNFEASPAGKVLEFITAGLTGGYVESDTEIADFVGGDGVHYSLKFLKPDSKYEGDYAKLYRTVVSEEKEIVYLTLGKTLDGGKVLNLDAVDIDKLRKSTIRLDFIFYKISKDKIMNDILYNRAKFRNALRAVSKEYEEFQEGGRFYNDIQSALQTKMSQEDYLKSLGYSVEKAKTTLKEKKISLTHAVAFFRNIVRLAQILDKLKNFRGGASGDATIKYKGDYIKKQIKRVELVINGIKKHGDESLKNSKSFQILDKSLEEVVQIGNRLGKTLDVSPVMGIFLVDKDYDFRDIKKRFLDRVLSAPENKGINKAVREGAFEDPSTKFIEERVRILKEKGIIGDISKEELELTYELYHLVRRLASSTQYEFKPFVGDPGKVQIEKQPDFIKALLDKIKDPGVLKTIGEEVAFDTGKKDEQGNPIYEKGIDTESRHGQKKAIDIKFSRSVFFQRLCEEDPNLPPVKLELSSDKFAETFNNFGEEFNDINRIIISQVRKICENLTAFNKSFRNSLTEGLTSESLRDPLDSIYNLAEGWNKLSAQTFKKKEREKRKASKNK